MRVRAKRKLRKLKRKVYFFLEWAKERIAIIALVLAAIVYCFLILPPALEELLSLRSESGRMIWAALFGGVLLSVGSILYASSSRKRYEEKLETITRQPRYDEGEDLEDKPWLANVVDEEYELLVHRHPDGIRVMGPITDDDGDRKPKDKPLEKLDLSQGAKDFLINLRGPSGSEQEKTPD